MQHALGLGPVSRVLKQTVAVVMAGGRGTRLNELTALRSKPAVPFAGKYRIIDFTLVTPGGVVLVCPRMLGQSASHAA